MNSNETRTLWISVGAALFAIFLLYSWSQEQKTELSRKFGSSKRVVVASQDIAEMETVDESKVELVEKPVDFVEPDAITDAEGAVGQIAVAPIRKGEQILQTKLLLPGPDTGLAMEVAPTKRAVTIPIDDMRGVSKLIRPGDRVDLVAALDYGRGMDQRKEVKTILQDVPVLATGLNIANKIPRRFEKDASGTNTYRVSMVGNTNFTNITIEAKPEEAQQIIYILATSPGSLFVTLRHPNDRYIQPQKTTAVEDVLGKPAARTMASAPIPQVAAAPPVAAGPLPKAGNRLPAKRKTHDGFEAL